MFKQSFAVLFLVIVAFSGVVQKTNAQASSEALSRVDAIIAEMQSLRAELAVLIAAQTPVAPLAPAVLGLVSSGVLGDDLSYGSTNGDIKKIQALLATDPTIYPYGVASGFFGPKTQEAIRLFQSRFDLDTVGVVGPSTRALLEVFLAAYPNGDYPSDVLSKLNSLPVVTPSPVTSATAPSTPVSVGVNPVKTLNVVLDDGEALVEIVYTNGVRKGLVVNSEDTDKIVAYIVSKTTLTTAQVQEVISLKTTKSSSRRSSADEQDADDAIDDAYDEIDDVSDAIDNADDDGDDIDWAEDTLDDAHDLLDDAESAYDDGEYEDAFDLAHEARNLAKKAEDRIDEEEGSEQGDSEDVDSIEVSVDEGESEVLVTYSDGSEYEFTVEEDTVESLIEEIADELDMSERDAEDAIEFDFGRIDHITVRIDTDSSLARVFYTSGVERRVRTTSIDEDDITDAVAKELGERTSTIEDVIEFD